MLKLVVCVFPLLLSFVLHIAYSSIVMSPDRYRCPADRAPPPSGTTLLRRFHAARRAVLSNGDIRCTDYLDPFLDTIRQEDTSGLVTQRALCAVRAFLSAGLLALDPAREAAAIVSTVHAATYCRFEVTDPAADEVVVLCILQLLVTCVECPSGGALSDEAVCEVVHSCYRISSQVCAHPPPMN
jgi:hypothetical protein